MPTINALLKKRQKLEQQIAAAQRLERRKAEVIALLERHDLLDLTDAEILSLLRRDASRPVTEDTHGCGV